MPILVYDYYPAYHPRLDAPRCASQMATQHRVGLRSQRWSGADFDYRSGALSSENHLKRNGLHMAARFESEKSYVILGFRAILMFRCRFRRSTRSSIAGLEG